MLQFLGTGQGSALDPVVASIFSRLLDALKMRAMVAACIAALIAFSFLPPAVLAWSAVEPSTARWSLSALIFFVTVAAWNFSEWLIERPERLRKKAAAQTNLDKLRATRE